MPLRNLVQIIAPLLVLLFYIWEDDNDDDYLFEEKERKTNYQRINCNARDIKGDLYGTAFFEPWIGMPQGLYDYLWTEFCEPISEPRNIYFNLPDGRRRRPCKISNENRFIQFLHDMNENCRVWTSATHNGWNISSISRDFAHCLIQFVKTFSDDWIKDLSDSQRRGFQGSYPGYPTVYKLVDGSMYRRQKTITLPPGVPRKTYYDYKHKMPEAVDVQLAITPNLLCVELLTGGPGSMGDANLSHFICRNDWDNSVLVDGTYPDLDQFIKPDNTDAHKKYRVNVENYIGRNKTEWSLTGGLYRRSKRLHNLAIRASVTLTNQKRVWNMLMNE